MSEWNEMTICVKAEVSAWTFLKTESIWLSSVSTCFLFHKTDFLIPAPGIEVGKILVAGNVFPVKYIWTPLADTWRDLVISVGGLCRYCSKVVWRIIARILKPLQIFSGFRMGILRL